MAQKECMLDEIKRKNGIRQSNIFQKNGLIMKVYSKDQKICRDTYVFWEVKLTESPAALVLEERVAMSFVFLCFF